MRTRKELERYTQEKSINTAHNSQVLIELLLDIRELLAAPAIQKDFGKREKDLSASNLE